MEVRTKARLEILAAALLFSTGGVAVKACALSGWEVAGLRSALGALTLAVLIPGARRGWTARTFLVGLAYAATLLLYVLANKLTTAANTIFLQSTAPLYLLLVSPLLLRERIRPRDLAFMAALALGLLLIFLGREPEHPTMARDPGLGNVLAACAGLCWALTIAGLRWLGRVEGEAGGASPGTAARAAVIGNVLVFGAYAIVGPVGGLVPALDLDATSTSDWLWVVYLGVFQIGLAYVFLTRGVRHVPALEVALLLLLEPVLNAILAWAVHGEVPGAWSKAGCAVILFATAAHAVVTARGTSRGGPSPS